MGWPQMTDCDTWPTPSEGCYMGCTIPEGTDEELLDAVAIEAGVILRTLSGHRFGTCTDTIRPICECPTCRGPCCCSNAGDRIRLSSPLGPVTSVVEVNVDGAEVDEDTWRFYPSSQLLYAVPPLIWPKRDHKWADCDADGTMCVDVVIGYEPDAWALAVHSELACELLKACTDQKCRIPRNATQVTGQGITVSLSATELKQFIPSVSAWVAAVNPDGALTLPRLYSPDLGGGDSGCGCH